MNHVQRVLEAAGTQARHIEQLWWFTIAMCLIVFVPLMAFYLWTLWRSPRAGEATPPDVEVVADPETKPKRAVVWSLVLMAIGLLVLLFASARTDRALAKMPV